MSFALTFLLYHSTVTTDAGFLWIYDDDELIADAADGFSVRDVFFRCGDHLCATTRALYYTLFSLFGRWWPPYGLVLVSAHALLSGLVGVVIWRIGGSVIVALAVAMPLAVSVPLATGPLLNFVHVVIYLVIIALLLLIVIVARAAARGSPLDALQMGALSLPTVFITTAALLLFPVTILYYVCFRLAAKPGCCGSTRFPYIRRTEVQLASTLIVILLAYAAATLTGISLYANGLPGQSSARTQDLETFPARFMDVVTYGLIALLPIPVALDRPNFVPLYYAHAGAFTVLIVAFFLWQTLALGVPASRPIRRMGACGLASVLMVLLYALVATLGRDAQTLTLGHMRYNAYAVTFWCLALGMLASIVVARMPGPMRVIPLALLAAGGLYLTYRDASTVEALALYSRRPKWWCDTRFETMQDRAELLVILDDKRARYCTPEPRSDGAGTSAQLTPADPTALDRVVPEPIQLEEGPREEPVASYRGNPPTAWTVLQTQAYSVTITNTGMETWHASATRTNRPFLGVHFGTESDARGTGWQTNQRFFLPRDVPPGDSVTIDVEVTAPEQPGTYVLRHRMARQGLSWSDQIHKTSVTVTAP